MSYVVEKTKEAIKVLYGDAEIKVEERDYDARYEVTFSDGTGYFLTSKLEEGTAGCRVYLEFYAVKQEDGSITMQEWTHSVLFQNK